MRAATHRAHELRDYSADRRLLLTASLAVPIGALGTVAAYVLLTLIHFFTNLFFFQTLSLSDRSPSTNTLGGWVIALPVLGGVIVGLMARFGSEKIRGHGIPEAIEAILFGKSRMSPKVAVLKPLSSGIVIGSGGPFGAEGPIIMTGGAIGSLLAQQFHLSAMERKALLVAGATAGMTAVFGTPVAAVMLAIELLLFELRPRSLLPVAIACAVAAYTRPLLLESGRLFPLHVGATTPAGFASCILLGLLAGVLAAALSTGLYWVEDCFHRLPVHWMWWPAIGGVAVGLGGWLQPRALGVGYDVISDLLNHRMLAEAAAALLLVKALMWMLALGSGTSGGVLAPLLMIGAGIGTVLSPWLPGGDASLWPLVSMAAMLSGALGAPLTATIFAFGLTGDANSLLPLLTGCMMSYGFNVLVMRRSIMTERISRRGRHVIREFGVDPHERTHVRDVMATKLEVIPSDTLAGDVAEMWFGKGQKYRAFPVVDCYGKFLYFMDRETVVASSRVDVAVGELAFSAGIGPFALPMETCRSVSDRMAATGQERLAVLSNADERKLIGIISRSDLIKPSLFSHQEEQVLEGPSRPSRRR